MTASESVLVLGSTSVTSWGHDQLERIVVEARSRGLGLVGMDLAERHEGPGRVRGEKAWFDELLVADVDDAASCVAAVRGRDDIAAVLTIRELSVLPVAVVARELGLRAADSGETQKCGQ